MAETYTTFGTGDVVPNVRQTITDAVWSNTSGSLTSFYTSSAQSSSTGDYYYDAYNIDPDANSIAEVQFAISYGHRFGSGSTQINDDSGDEGLTPSRAIYSQYRNFLLPSTATQFTIGSSNTDQIIAINFQRARCAERLDEGNWEMSISGSGEGALYTFIDDSTINSNPTVSEGGVVYNMVSGSIQNGVFTPTTPTYVGLMYPQHSLLIMDAEKVGEYGIDIVSSSAVDGDNHGKVLTSINAAGDLGTDYGFKARNEENIRSTYYFCRIRNADYNYSLNPSFYSGSDARIRHSDMLTNPQTYITTVGLYNESNELLAVAKLSQPFRKNFHRECILRLKIDF